MSRAASPDPRRQKCPVCGKPPSGAHGPFCGQGCRDRDLLKWLGDDYRVPGPPADAFSTDDGLDSEGGPPL